MSWRETWRETVESFLREVRDPDAPVAPPRPGDAVLAALERARAEVFAVERDLAEAQARRDAESDAAAVCERRRGQAERIGDTDTARVAESFRRRHLARADVFTRKAAVLGDELAIARATLDDLLEYARSEVSPATERRP